MYQIGRPALGSAGRSFLFECLPEVLGGEQRLPFDDESHEQDHDPERVAEGHRFAQMGHEELDRPEDKQRRRVEPVELHVREQHHAQPCLQQRQDDLQALLQTGLGVVLLANMEFDWFDATALFALWVVQFLSPHLREEVSVAYALWIVILLVRFAIKGQPLLAWKYFWQTLTQKRSAGTT